MNANVKRWVLRILPWLLLWGAFVAFGAWVRSVQPWPVHERGIVELHGMDYRRYSQLLGDWCMIFYAAFRHPLYGWLMSPIIGISARFHEIGEVPFWGWLIAFFSTVMTLAHVLVYWLLRRLSLDQLGAAALTALFASFAFSWLLAACPESFNISCLLALATLHFALYVRRHADTLDKRLEYVGWGALALSTGGITSTQVVKTALAYLVTRKPKLRQIVLIGLGILGAAVLVGIVFIVRLYLRTPPEQFASAFVTALANIGGYLVGARKSLSYCLGRVFVFFTEPIVTRGVPFSESTPAAHYASPFVAILALLPILLAVIAGIWARRAFIVRVIAAMFLVDVGIHFCLFWGMDEAQIYAGHWFYAVPILIGMGLVRLRGRPRGWATLAVGCCAAAILACNLYAWFGH